MLVHSSPGLVWSGRGGKQWGNAPFLFPDQRLPGLGNGLGALPYWLPPLPDQSTAAPWLSQTRHCSWAVGMAMARLGIRLREAVTNPASSHLWLHTATHLSSDLNASAGRKRALLSPVPGLMGFKCCMRCPAGLQGEALLRVMGKALHVSPNQELVWGKAWEFHPTAPVPSWTSLWVESGAVGKDSHETSVWGRVGSFTPATLLPLRTGRSGVATTP